MTFKINYVNAADAYANRGTNANADDGGSTIALPKLRSGELKRKDPDQLTGDSHVTLKSLLAVD